MKKSFKLQNLDCANCAAKMETAISKLDGVDQCSISFMTQKMIIDAEENDFPQILEAAQIAIGRVERKCKIIK